MTVCLARLAVAALALSCALPMGGASDARSAIEGLLQRRADAIARNDVAAFRSTVDGTRAALRRTQQELFDMTRARGVATAMTRVVRVETYGSYTRAYVEDDPQLMLLGMSGPPGYRRLYFRQQDGKWIVTEPTVEELGGERRQRIGDVDLEHWAIDDDVVELVAREVAALSAEVARAIPWAPPASFSIRLYPTEETIGLSREPGVVAAHVVNDPRDRALRVYRLWWAPSLGELAPFSRFVLRDQVLGLTRDQLAPRAHVRMDWWLRQGLGHAYSGPDASGALRAVCAEPLTWKQMFDGPQMDEAIGGGGGMGVSFAPTYGAFVSSTTPRAFVQARSFVEHLRAVRGDRAYWDLVLAYAETPDPKVAYAKALNVSPERFYSDWLSWARTHC